MQKLKLCSMNFGLRSGESIIEWNYHRSLKSGSVLSKEVLLALSMLSI